MGVDGMTEQDGDVGDVPTAAELLEIGRRIFETMASGGAGIRTRPRPGIRESKAYFPTVYALTRHTLHSGRAMMNLYEAGDELVSMPLARMTFQCAIYAQWLVHSEEALGGLLNEGYRQRKAVSRAMAASVNALFNEGASRVAHIDEEDIDSIATDAARNFEQLCNSLQGGHDAYIYYRLLSGMSHPSISLVDEYVKIDPDRPTSVILGRNPERIGHDSWLFLTVAAMIWGARALDHLDDEHVHRSFLRDQARRLRVAETLALTQEARAAEWQAGKERRHQSWRGPRQRKRADSE